MKYATIELEGAGWLAMDTRRCASDETRPAALRRLRRMSTAKYESEYRYQFALTPREAGIAQVRWQFGGELLLENRLVVVDPPDPLMRRRAKGKKGKGKP